MEAQTPEWGIGRARPVADAPGWHRVALPGEERERCRPTPERCCKRECEYNPERVRYHMARLRDYQRAGQLPGRLYSVPRYDGTVSTANGEGETAGFDITRAIAQLRADGKAITPESVAGRLCPFALVGVTP